MKSVVFGASLLAAVFAGSAASAPAVAAGSDPVPAHFLEPAAEDLYADPAEGFRNMGPPPGECLDAAGTNACVAVMIAHEGDDGIIWLPAWSVQDEHVICVDPTADWRVDCNAPDAVRSRETALLVPRIPRGDGTYERGEPRYRQLPWREVPKS